MSMVRHDQHGGVVRGGVVEQCPYGLVGLREALFRQVASQLITIRPTGIEVFPRFVLQVVQQLEDNHEHIPAVAFTQPLGHVRALVKAAGDVIEIVSENGVATEGSSSPLGL